MDGRHHDDLVELASALRTSVFPLSRALKFGDTELTPTQMSVLGAVQRGERSSMGEIAEREHLSPAMVSRVVDSLVDRDFVERTRSEHDRRVCHIALSDTGRAWIEQGRVERNAWLADRLATLTADQRQILAEAAPLLVALAHAAPTTGGDTATPDDAAAPDDAERRGAGR